MSQDDLKDILQDSRESNISKDVTGMLLYIEGRFFQVLEGEKEGIDELYEHISRDERHRDVNIITRGYTKRRIFKDWSMRYSSISSKEFTRLSGIKRFSDLLRIKKPQLEQQVVMFMNKFSDKTFPSPSWWS